MSSQNLFLVKQKDIHEDKLELRDTFAFLLLKDFIVNGFPAVDPRVQIDAAYQYADLMISRRKLRP
jgi:hypothetical protein